MVFYLILIRRPSADNSSTRDLSPLTYWRHTSFNHCSCAFVVFFNRFCCGLPWKLLSESMENLYKLLIKHAFCHTILSNVYNLFIIYKFQHCTHIVILNTHQGDSEYPTNFAERIMNTLLDPLRGLLIPC